MKNLIAKYKVEDAVTCLKQAIEHYASHPMQYEDFQSYTKRAVLSAIKFAPTLCDVITANKYTLNQVQDIVIARSVDTKLSLGERRMYLYVTAIVGTATAIYNKEEAALF